MGFRTTVVASASKIQREAISQAMKWKDLEPVAVEHPANAGQAATSWQASMMVVDLASQVDKPLALMREMREALGDKVVLIAMTPSVTPKTVAAVLKAGGDDVTLLGAPPKSIVTRVMQWSDLRTKQPLAERRRLLIERLESADHA